MIINLLHKTKKNEVEDTTAAVLMAVPAVPDLCSLESVCGQACVYRHIAKRKSFVYGWVRRGEFRY